MKKLIFPIFFVLLFPFRAQADDTLLTYTDHFYLALDHYNKKRFQLAENEFKNILIDKRNFEDPVSHFMLAKAQYNLKKNWKNKMIELGGEYKLWSNSPENPSFN